MTTPVPYSIGRACAGALLAFATSAIALPAAGRAQGTAHRAPPVLARATELLVVTTPGWDSTSGHLWRFTRARPGARWRAVASAVPVVVGRTGIALGDGFDRLLPHDAAAPHKHEGDGRSPAGAFPLTSVFGFAPADSMRQVRMPYTPLTEATDCVDDTASRHYNDVVDRSAVPAVDWHSAEHMRQVGQYRIGVVVGYNAGRGRVPGRGSCIFLHIWAGPGSTTVGCTAFDEGELGRVIAWLDPKARPVLVQLTRGAYAAVREGWKLPDVQ